MMKSPDGKNCPIPDAKKVFTFAMAILCHTNFRLKVEQKALATYVQNFVICIVFC